MKIEFVGCGAGFSAGLGNNNVMLYKDRPEDGYWLIDCGETTRVKLVERNLINSLQGVIITHLHGDHVYGLEMLGFWWYFVNKRSLPLILPSVQMKEELWSILKPTMSQVQDSEGNPVTATMEDYFRVTYITPPDFVSFANDKGEFIGRLDFIANSHVPLKESFAVELRGR